MTSKGHGSSRHLALGIVSGIGLRLFIGELAAVFAWVAEGYLQLLHMTVLPYVTVSLVWGLGSLSSREAKLLFTRVGAVVQLLWTLALLLLFFIPLAYPDWESASFFSTSLLKPPEEFDFLSLYIPANPFHALANNVVPAVVLFSLAIGIALIGVEKKQGLLDDLAVLNRALTAINRFVVRLAPFGIFAIAANMAGTMSLSELERIEVFVLTYVLTTLLFTFWILPGLVAAMTPVSYRQVIGRTKDALLTAFMTGNLFVVLPMLTDATTELLRERKLLDPDDEALPDVIIPISFNFPHTAKVLTLSFILFASWFSESSISWTRYPELALSGVASLFGSMDIAVPFLLDRFEIPADMFDLFLATGIVNSRFGTMVAAMHTVTVALLGTAAVAGTLSLNRLSLLRYTFVSAALAALTIGGAGFVLERTLEHEYHADKVLENMHQLRAARPATVFREAPDLSEGESLLDRIRRRGAIRVGYLADGIPYSFFNASGELVGFDVEMAHDLAEEIGVELELVPVDRRRLAELLDGSYCDLVMAGIVVTTRRARDVLFTAPYMDETLAFLVPDHRRSEFGSAAAVKEMTPLRLAVPNLPGLDVFLREHLPHAELVPFDNPRTLFRETAAKVDAILMTAERGSAWSLLHPELSVAVTQPNPPRLPLAYAVANRDEALKELVDIWLEVKKRDGTLREVYDYWILGRDAEPRVPRWSVVRNVLHWVE